MLRAQALWQMSRLSGLALLLDLNWSTVLQLTRIIAEVLSTSMGSPTFVERHAYLLSRAQDRLSLKLAPPVQISWCTTTSHIQVIKPDSESAAFSDLLQPHSSLIVTSTPTIWLAGKTGMEVPAKVVWRLF